MDPSSDNGAILGLAGPHHPGGEWWPDDPASGGNREGRVIVGKWRERFVHNRLDGLLDEPRPGSPRRIGDDLVERVLSMTLESKPTAHWITRGMARRIGIGLTRCESIRNRTANKEIDIALVVIEQSRSPQGATDGSTILWHCV